MLPLALLLPALTLATPAPSFASDTSTDMDAVIRGGTPCASHAVLFARGTFDSGNLGVWVGPFLKDSVLSALAGDVHVQGVNAGDYAANLADYVKEGGSESCADACARTVDAYVEKCPGANVFVSGWSQGALCAHKCVNRISPNAATQLKGLATFGDENALMDEPELVPSGLPFKAYCNEDNTSPDLLCTQSALSGVDLPSSIAAWKAEVYDNLALLKDVATNPAQLKAAAALPVSILSGFFGVSRYFLLDVATGNVRRWLVLPPHFVYGNNGMADQAAKWMASLV
ncbi:alpha/beta-hydrolase [Paraphaeosphaeria sporulosa]|uniref:cutinase n=1 Tax=Paraphaeosphaeria sporulosa TaxID=1460663 RepID=A0A177CGX7_9PLEO|nr:alpha/beta-hydrolase [Paraphaeosphaeria sporulosa]OAG05957.1 alpha/beta-hydrolase [Paraphaeosphaeria sporulosa]